MVKTSKIIATLGVAAGLGIALLPVASHAYNSTGSNIVQVNVPGWIDLSVANNASTNNSVTAITGGAKVSLSETNRTSTDIEHILRVRGSYNKKYTLTMSTPNETNGTSLVGQVTGNTIPSISGTNQDLPATSGEGSANNHGWGYRADVTSNAQADGGTYESAKWNAIPDSTGVNLRSPLTGTDKITENFDDYTYVNFGIVIAETEVADTYQQTINYTVEGSPANS